jgi:hypothetical protein
MNIFSQSELSRDEAGVFESRLLGQGFREAHVRFDEDLAPREYRKPCRVGVAGRLLDESWWTVSWRPGQ